MQNACGWLAERTASLEVHVGDIRLAFASIVLVARERLNLISEQFGRPHVA